MAVLGTVGCIYCWTLQENIEVIHFDMERCFGSNPMERQWGKKILPTDADCCLCVICGACHGYENVPFCLHRPAAFSLYLIARHVTSCRGTLENNPIVGKLWVMVVAMVLFFCAQRYAGMWRVWMLVASTAMVAYVCWRTFGKQGLAGISIMATVYLGIFLPTVAIGYNQYV